MNFKKLKLALTLGLAIVCTNTYSTEWQPIEENDLLYTYMDSDSITLHKKNGLHLVRAWTRVDYKKNLPNTHRDSTVVKAGYSAKSLRYFDCVNKKFSKPEDEKIYNTKGIVVNETEADSNLFEHIIPDSIGYGFWDTVCTFAVIVDMKEHGRKGQDINFDDLYAKYPHHLEFVMEEFLKFEDSEQNP